MRLKTFASRAMGVILGHLLIYRDSCLTLARIRSSQFGRRPSDLDAIAIAVPGKRAEVEVAH